MTDTNCELCHKRQGRAVADAWLCDVCERIMDPEVMAFYREQNKADQASLTARLGAAEKHVEILRADRDDIRSSAAQWEERALKAETALSKVMGELAQARDMCERQKVNTMFHADRAVRALEKLDRMHDQIATMTEQCDAARAEKEDATKRADKASKDFHKVYKETIRWINRASKTQMTLNNVLDRERRQRRTIRALVVAARALRRAAWSLRMGGVSKRDVVMFVRARVGHINRQSGQQAGEG